MISDIGFFVLLIGGINTLWRLLWLIMAQSSMAGAKISKKVGTNNENTAKNIEVGESFSKQILSDLVPRVAVTIIGLLMYLLG
ncbi:hypothetical protein [Bernardetia sp.]|uniref:hypothetical protein n=1 Tax=Bernardetia sp. TaxID=1937974 RepID=UPI0025B82E32|nr:hypothetical protein [Bernardetia sp.]